MKINIQATNFAPKAELLDFAKEKLNKLIHFDSQIIKSDVWLKLERAENGENKVCEVKLLAHGKDFFASSQCATFEEATVRTVTALEKQLKHHKEKAQ